MIPVKDSTICATPALVGWLIIAICCGIFIVMQFMPEQSRHYFTYLYGMTPIRYSNPHWGIGFGLPPDHGLSFLTSLFLHGGWFHLLLNMWFIWIFADKIEHSMGHGLFLCFYLACGLIATVTQWYFTPSLPTPVVGASGAIAGVLGAYFFLYPYSRIRIWIPILFLPIFVEIPAIAFLGFWVIVQINEATSTIIFENQTLDVAWWAHLGGFAAGAVLHKLFLRHDLNDGENQRNH